MPNKKEMQQIKERNQERLFRFHDNNDKTQEVVWRVDGYEDEEKYQINRDGIIRYSNGDKEPYHEAFDRMVDEAGGKKEGPYRYQFGVIEYLVGAVVCGVSFAQDVDDLDYVNTLREVLSHFWYQNGFEDISEVYVIQHDGWIEVNIKNGEHINKLSFPF